MSHLLIYLLISLGCHLIFKNSALVFSVNWNLILKASLYLVNNLGECSKFFFLNRHTSCSNSLWVCPLNFNNFSFSPFLSKSLALAKSFFSYLLLKNYFITPFWNLSVCIPDVTILIFPVTMHNFHRGEMEYKKCKKEKHLDYALWILHHVCKDHCCLL